MDYQQLPGLIEACLAQAHIGLSAEEEETVLFDLRQAGWPQSCVWVFKTIVSGCREASPAQRRFAILGLGQFWLKAPHQVLPVYRTLLNGHSLSDIEDVLAGIALGEVRGLESEAARLLTRPYPLWIERTLRCVLP